MSGRRSGGPLEEIKRLYGVKGSKVQENATGRTSESQGKISVFPLTLIIMDVPFSRTYCPRD